MTFGVLQVVLIGLNGLTTCPGPTVLHHRFHHMTADLPLLHCPNSRGALFDAVHNTRLCRWQCFVVRGRGARGQDSSFVVESTTPVPRALLSEEQIHHRAARHAQTKMAIRKEGSLPSLRVGHRSIGLPHTSCVAGTRRHFGSPTAKAEMRRLRHGLVVVHVISCPWWPLWPCTCGQLHVHTKASSGVM